MGKRSRSAPGPRPDGAGPARIMLVGSSGGHLSQLLALAPWYDTRQARTWVTFRTPDAMSRLAGEQVTWAYHPTTRNVANLLRNTVLAWREVRRLRPDLIVSTGAAVAFPFFVVGRLHRVRTAYIEVRDRLDSRTLTARLCRPLTSLFCVQLPEQERLYPGAVVLGSLLPLDGRRATPLPTEPATVLVLLGTDVHPFERLVSWIEACADASPATTFFVQHGHSRAPERVAGLAFVDHDELQVRLARAAAVVTHGGPSSIAEAARLGHVPIVVARDPGYGEHVDDHQERFAARLDERGTAIVVRSAEELAKQLRSTLDDHDPTVDPADVPNEVADESAPQAAARFGALVATLFSRAAARA
jgi:UDP-N-acetylglucosamine transferase subunit ALG13